MTLKLPQSNIVENNPLFWQMVLYRGYGTQCGPEVASGGRHDDDGPRCVSRRIHEFVIAYAEFRHDTGYTIVFEDAPALVAIFRLRLLQKRNKTIYDVALMRRVPWFRSYQSILS